MAQPIPYLIQQFFDSNGKPLAGGMLYSYAAGTTTPLATYTDQGAGTPNTNPVVLDASGSASIFIPEGVGYKFILQDSLGNVQWTKDNIYIIEPSSITGSMIASTTIEPSNIDFSTLVSSDLPNNIIDTANIKNSAVTTAKVGSGTLEPSNIDPAADFSTLDKMIEVVIKNKSDMYGSVFEVVPQLPWTSPSRLGDPATPPGSQVSAAAWSPCGRFLALSLALTPFILIYERTGSTLVKLADPSILPAAAPFDLAWSPCGAFLAVGHASSPFITIYNRIGSVFNKLPNPATLPPGNATAIKWSPNGEFLAVFSTTSSHVQIYQITYQQTGWIGAKYTFTDLASSNATSQNPVVTSASYSFTKADIGKIINITSGTNFAVGYYEIISVNGSGGAVFAQPCAPSVSSPSGGHYELSPSGGPVFTALSAPGTLPGSSPGSCSWSYDSQFLAVSSTFGTYVTVYQITGTTFTALSLGSQPSAPAASIAFSPDGKFITAGLSSTPYIAIYQISGTTFTLQSNPASLPSGSVNGVSWSPNATLLAMAISGSPYVQFYAVSATTFTLQPNPGSLPPGTTFAAAFSPNCKFLALGGGTSPYITTYQSTSIFPTDALLWVRNFQDV